MAGDVKVAVVSTFLSAGASGTTDFTKTGFGTPKACILIVSEDNSDDANTATESRVSIGFSDFTNNYCIVHQDEDSSAKVDCDSAKSNTKIFYRMDVGASFISSGTASTITNGVRITNDGSVGVNKQATVIMFGGADLAVSLQSSAIASSQDGTATISHSGFTDGNDKLIFFIGSDISGEDSASTGINNSFGVCHATGSDAGGWTFSQRAMGWSSDHNATEANPSGILRNDLVLANLTEVGASDWGLEVTALDHSPAEWTVTTRVNGAGSGMEVYSLALDLDDRSAKVGSVDGPTSGATWAPSVSLGFTPQYVGLFLTRRTSEQTVGSGATIGISSNTGPGEETCHTWYNEDGAATTNTNNLFRSRAIDIRDENVSTVIQDHSHSSFDSGGWTYTINTENEATARKWFYWAIEGVVAAGPNIIVPLKTFTLAKQDPTIETGVNVPVPTPKAFSLGKLTPAAGTSVLVTTPAPKAFSLSKLLPGIETGVAIIVPAPKAYSLNGFDPQILVDRNVIVPAPKAYSLNGFDPNVGTGLIVTVPAPKSYSLTGFDPTINLGVNVVAPTPKAYTLAGQNPAIGTGVIVAAPVPKAYTLAGFEPVITTAINVNIVVPTTKGYTLAGQLPTVETGVTIITPLGTFTLTGFDPTIETGVTIVTPLGSYSLTGFEPIISIGATVVVPAPKGYSLTGFDPAIASGVNIFVPVPKAYSINGFAPGITTLGAVEIIVPLGAFSLTGFDPSIQTGVTIITPLGTFNLTGFDPAINIGVNVITPLGTFTLAGFDPVVGSGLNVTVPLGSFTRTNFLPGVASGVGVVVPLQVYTLTGFVPLVGTGANVIVPAPKAYTITGFLPFVEKVIEIRVALKEFDLTGFVPVIHSNRPPILAADILDLTPPWSDISQLRYLIRNFAVLRDLLEAGVDGQFTTSDGKTALVRGGVIVDLY